MSRTIHLANPYGVRSLRPGVRVGGRRIGKPCEGDGYGCHEEPNDLAICRGPSNHVRTSRSWWYG